MRVEKLNQDCAQDHACLAHVEQLRADLTAWCDALETKNRELCALNADYKAAELKFSCY